MAERDPLYAGVADVIVDTNGLTRTRSLTRSWLESLEEAARAFLVAEPAVERVGARPVVATGHLDHRAAGG